MCYGHPRGAPADANRILKQETEALLLDLLQKADDFLNDIEVHYEAEVVKVMQLSLIHI